MTFHLLFVPSAIVLGAMLAAGLQSINPFAAEDPPMLEQIEREMQRRATARVIARGRRQCFSLYGGKVDREQMNTYKGVSI